MGTTETSSWTDQVLRPIDGAWLGAFRALFGLAMCVSMIRFIAYGWVERFFVEPTFHFKYWGFGWVQPLDPAGMQALFWALAAFSLCVAFGFCFRAASWLFAVGLTYIQLLDVSTYLNHYYLASLLSFLLAASPAGRIWSVDNLLAKKRNSQVAALWLYLLRFQIGTVYTFAGLAKLNSDWLVHAQPLRIWLGAKTHLPIVGPLFTFDGVPLAMSWAGFLFDSTIVLWLSYRRTRPWAYLVVLTFHIMTRVLFPIGMFPVIMTLAALVFFEPDWPRQLVRRLRLMGTPLARWYLGHDSAALSDAHRLPKAADMSAAPHLRMKLRFQRMGALLAVAYCGVQLALPLRFLAYDGNVLWHEQGMRFAWRVMLRAKGGSARFVVEELGMGRKVYVDPDHYLTDLQVAEMVSQPDLILQLAHHIQQDYEQRGWTDVAVRVQSRISLNGRRSKALVDPNVDLTSHRDGLQPLAWVTEAPPEPPHHTRPVL